MLRIVTRYSKRLFRSSVTDFIESASKKTALQKIRQYESFRCISSCNIRNSHQSTTSDLSLSEQQKENNEESSHEEVETEQHSDWEYERDIKCVILDASLSFVPVHGWTKNALIAGAQSIGYPGVVAEMFPLGGASLVLYFYEKCNLALREYLKEKQEQTKESSKLQSGEEEEELVKSLIADAIEMRLRLVIPFIDKWPSALACLTTPSVAPHALTNLFTLVDDIAFYAGDRSADLDWYIRRVGIAGIYKVTEIYMLQDKSADYADTWSFLKKQLDDAILLYSYIRKSESATQFTKDISTATFTTARNMLGLNWNR